VRTSQNALCKADSPVKRCLQKGAGKTRLHYDVLLINADRFSEFCRLLQCDALCFGGQEEVEVTAACMGLCTPLPSDKK
jgi:hypothetical protein